MKNKIGLPRILTILAAILLIGALQLPIWQIQLSAPQYPEGLVMKIWANKLAGDVQIINGLNHYIGMQTLHTDDFIEFTVLPYIILSLILFSIITVIFNRRTLYFINAVFIVLVGIISMVDFYRWEYDYGHNLNPTAPIQVPGMAYQPPLIGYKQLLNFGAFSIPDIGGWMFIGSGVCMVLAFIFILISAKRNVRIPHLTIAAAIILFSLTGCSQKPQPIRYGADGCDFCKMTIMDKKFASQIVTDKGKNFRFDDIHCLLEYRKANNLNNENSTSYVNDYSGENLPIKTAETFFIKNPDLKTPMAGHIAGFSSQKDQEQYLQQHGGNAITWSELITEP